MANPDIFQVILSTVMIVLATLWILTEFLILKERILTFLGRRVGGGGGNPAESENVERALAAMYDAEGAKYRKSEHGLRKNGGHNA